MRAVRLSLVALGLLTSALVLSIIGCDGEDNSTGGSRNEKTTADIDSIVSYVKISSYTNVVTPEHSVDSIDEGSLTAPIDTNATYGTGQEYCFQYAK